MPPPIRIAEAALVAVALGAAGCWSTTADAPSAPTHSNVEDGPRGAVSIVVSGDTAGWITPCGCTSNQSGGLARRTGFVNSLDDPVVVVDVGGAPGGMSPYDLEKFEWILRGELAMGLAVHNVGTTEARIGIDHLRSLASRLEVPFISANLQTESGEPAFPAHRVVDVAGRRIGFVGVLSNATRIESATIADPLRSALEAVRLIRNECETVVVLAYLDEPELRDLAANLPEADIVVGGPTGQSITPEPIGNRLLASATNKGKFVVHLVAAEGTDRWTGRSVEITDAFPDAPEQASLVTMFRESLAERDFRADETGFAPAHGGTWPDGYRVAGTSSCRACHTSACESWDASGHAHAWQTLLDAEAASDPACQRCHTTGYGLPGGFVSLASSQVRGGVGCESCHGPSAGHVDEPARRTPLVAEDSCRRCHDAENSPEFEYAPYWERVEHGSDSPKAPESP